MEYSEISTARVRGDAARAQNERYHCGDAVVAKAVIIRRDDSGRGGGRGGKRRHRHRWLHQLQVHVVHVVGDDHVTAVTVILIFRLQGRGLAEHYGRLIRRRGRLRRVPVHSVAVQHPVRVMSRAYSAVGRPGRFHPNVHHKWLRIFSLRHFDPHDFLVVSGRVHLCPIKGGGLLLRLFFI